MKNNVDTGIFEELTHPSIENLAADIESSKMTSEDINKENNTYENVEKVKMVERIADDKRQEKEEAKGDVNKEGLAEQSEDDGKRNAFKQTKETDNSRDDKIKSFDSNANRPHNIVSQYSTIGDDKGMQEVNKDAVPNIVTGGECTTHQFSSLEVAEKSIEMNTTVDNTEEKEDDGNEMQKIIGMLKDDKAKTKNLVVNISAGKNEKEEKKQPVMSTLAVPASTKPGRDSRGKELPISEPLGTTEVKITIEQDEERCDNAEDDDGDISPNDLLCFAWQIAQGMVSKLCNYRYGDISQSMILSTMKSTCNYIPFPPNPLYTSILCCPPVFLSCVLL